MTDIDCLISASAVGVQPIPCTAALIHERVAKGLTIPAMDINTTCTSFVSALSTVSYLIEGGEYRRVLIVSSEVGSLGLNPKQKESFELFSDGAAAFIFEATKEDKGIIASMQRTWSEGAHDTEIRGGLTAYHPKLYSEATKTDFMFDMKGKKILLLSARVIPEMFQEFQEKSGISKDAVDYIIPHQASRALPLVMDKLGVGKDKYLNIVSDYGKYGFGGRAFRPSLCTGSWLCEGRRYHLLDGNCSWDDGQYVGTETLMMYPLISSSKSIKSR